MMFALSPKSKGHANIGNRFMSWEGIFILLLQEVKVFVGKALLNAQPLDRHTACDECGKAPIVRKLNVCVGWAGVSFLLQYHKNIIVYHKYINKFLFLYLSY